MTSSLKFISFSLFFITFSNIGFAQNATYPCYETYMNEAPSSSGSLTATNVTKYTFKYYAQKGTSPQTTIGTANSRDAAERSLNALKQKYQSSSSCMTLGGKIIGSYPE